MPATTAQRELAAKVGLELGGHEPASVVAVMLEDHLAPSIRGEERRAATAKQKALVAQLDPDLPGIESMSLDVASGWIEHLLEARRADALRRVPLSHGTKVVHRRRWTDPVSGEAKELVMKYQVSSIGPNGRVHFMGGNGQGAWPDELEVLGEDD